ncbi:MAG: glycosyltransferase family 2 protein [Planctomycetes bacterium]|nr:glycosyltransferase family 2 protein [Planctomycetota bacterium]
MPDAPTTESWLPDGYEPGLISVVVPTFNREALLPATLASVFAQDYRPIEVIVADDGSTDGTRAMLKALAVPEGVALHVSEADHEGASASRNRGARLSRGEFVMFLDSDDLLEPGALMTLVRTIAGADLAVGAWCDLEGGKRSEAIRREFGDDWFVDLLNHQWFATCATLHRRAALLRAEAWNGEVPHDDDFHFVAMLGLAGAKLASTPEVVALYRRHDSDQITRRDLAAKSHDTQRVLQRIERDLDSRDAWTSARREALAFRYFKTGRMVWYYAGDVDRFEELVHEAIRVQPGFRPPKNWYRWIAGLVGYPNAERVAAIGRKLFR